MRREDAAADWLSGALFLAPPSEALFWAKVWVTTRAMLGGPHHLSLCCCERCRDARRSSRRRR